MPREASANFKRPPVPLSRAPLENRKERASRERPHALVGFDDDLVFGDHGSARRVDPAFEHVGLDLRRVQLIYVAPAFSDEVCLVAVELEVPVPHPVEVASEPLTRGQTKPVLAIAKLDPVARWKSRFGVWLGADALGFHPGLLEGLRAIGFRLADLSMQCGCLAQDRCNHKHYKRNKT